MDELVVNISELTDTDIELIYDFNKNVDFLNGGE